MKKSIFAATLASVLISGMNMAYASDGTINFTGQIKDTSCTIGDGSGDALSIFLGTPGVNSFKDIGDTSGAARFNISLSSCPPAQQKIQIAFEGIADQNTGEILKINPGSGTAKGVGIRIEEADGTPVVLNTTDPLELKEHELDSGAVKVNYVAKYQATVIPVTAGQANATAQFSIMYL